MNIRRERPKSFAKNRDGSVTIEFVTTLPLFLAALAFSFEFGQFFLAHQSTVNNVRAASRYLSRVDLSNEVVRTLAYNNARNLITTGQLSGGIAPAYLADACLPVTDCVNINYDSGRAVRIRVRAQYELSIFWLKDVYNPDSPASIPFLVVEDVTRVGS